MSEPMAPQGSPQTSEPKTKLLDENSPYYVEGFNINNKLDRRVKYRLEKYHPYSSNAVEDADLTVKYAIMRNLLVIFRALVFFQSFSDQPDFLATAADDLGYDRDIFKEIVEYYCRARSSYQVVPDRTYIDPAACQFAKVLCSLVDSYRLSRILPLIMTDKRKVYIAQVRDAWRRAASENPTALPESSPAMPAPPTDVDWLVPLVQAQRRRGSPAQAQQWRRSASPEPERPAIDGGVRQKYRSRSPLREALTFRPHPRVSVSVAGANTATSQATSTENQGSGAQQSAKLFLEDDEDVML